MIRIADIDGQLPYLQSVIYCAAKCMGHVIPSECAVELRNNLGVPVGFADVVQNYNTEAWEIIHHVAEAFVDCSENVNDSGLACLMGSAIVLKTSVRELVLAVGMDTPITETTWDLTQTGMGFLVAGYWFRRAELQRREPEFDPHRRTPRLPTPMA